MTGYKYAKPTKNGKTRCFKFSYNVKFDATKQYRFKRYSSREEESDAERIILGNYADKVEDNNMTIEDIYNIF